MLMDVMLMDCLVAGLPASGLPLHPLLRDLGPPLPSLAGSPAPTASAPRLAVPGPAPAAPGGRRGDDQLASCDRPRSPSAAQSVAEAVCGGGGSRLSVVADVR